MMTRELLRTLLLVQVILRLGRVACDDSAHADDQEQQSASSAVPSGLSGPDYTGPSAGSDECDREMVGFEVVTGYVYSAPTNSFEGVATLMVTECLDLCQANDSCQAVNFETGLCVMFTSNADSNPGALSVSHFPVFTVYAQKSCLAVKPCDRAWCIDRVPGYRLQGHTRRTMTASSRQHCVELCLGERDFACRSANYMNATKQCELSDMDRLTVAGLNAYHPVKGYDYLENQCVVEPSKLCDFKKISGRILKTVDSVIPEIQSAEECREQCLQSLFRCHTYDYGEMGDMVCRLSHHSRATLSDIHEPYTRRDNASTYERGSCYNITLDCQASDMVTRIQTTKLFSGKVYVKGSPNSCVQDVKEALEFELRIAYDDLECNVRQQGLGRYLNEIVIQHHDKVVTSSDVGFAVSCQYDLTNKTVSNEVDLGVHADITPALSEEVTVDSPNVAMKITDRSGNEGMSSAEVGDPLALKFEILNPNSPYEIFVRELVAMDGIDSNEIELIDSKGCPTDHTIMGPVYKPESPVKILLSHFDAFKFPSSEVVQFRALVTPCMPTCEPIQCDKKEPTGEIRSLISYGRRRRRRSTVPGSQKREDMLLVRSIKIMDKIGYQHDRKTSNASAAISDTVFIESEDISSTGVCINLGETIVAGTLFLVAQIAVIAAWAITWQRRRQMLKHQEALSVSVSVPSMHSGSGRTDSLCKLYDTGYSARRF